MKPQALVRLQKTLVILFLLCLGGTLATVYFGAKTSISALLEADWATYVDSPDDGRMTFTLTCLRNNECRPVLRELFTTQGLYLFTQVLAGGFATFLILAAFMGFFAKNKLEEKDPGGGKFASDEDLRAYLRDDKDPKNPRKGHFGYTESGKQLRAPLRDRCTHLAIFAGTGGGKTTRVIKPSLIQDALDGTSVLMVDPKWPDPQGGYSDTLAIFKEQGYEVQVFCPFEEYTLRLPLLGSLKSADDAEVLASTIIPKTMSGEVSDGSQFYRNQERELLKHLLWGQAQAGRGSVGDIYDLIDGGPKALNKWQENCPDKKIQKSMTTLMQNRQETLIGIIQGLKGSLSIFTNERLDAATQAGSHDSQNLDATALTRKKSVLYVGIPQQMFLRGEGKLLLNLFFRRIMDEILGVATKKGGRLEQHLAVYIDEFAHVGKLEHAGSWFGTMRSYNIAFTVALQNRAQLEMVYGSVGARAMEGGNFQHLITFPAALKGDDKEYVSKLLGEVTVEERANSESSEGIFGLTRKTVTLRRVARPLLSREEMNKWDSDYGVLLPHGAGPTKIAAPMIHQKRVGKVRNGFYRFRNQIGQGDSVSLVKTLLSQYEIAWRTPELPEPEATEPKLPEPSEAIKPRVDVYEAAKAADAPHIFEDATDDAPPAPQAEAPEAPVQVFAEPNKPAKETRKPAKKPSDASSSDKETKPAPSKEEALHLVPSGELMPSFRLWVEGLNWRNVPLTVFRIREGGQDRISKILFDELPGALRHEHLAHWKQRRWVQIRGEKLGIINNGCAVLCPKQLDAFMVLPKAQVIEIGEGSERVVVKARERSTEQRDFSNHNASALNEETETPPTPTPQPHGAEYEPKAQAALKNWLLKNSYRLDGHPNYAYYQDHLPHKSIPGRFIPELLYVQEAYLKNLPDFPLAVIARFPIVEMEIDGKHHHTREIPGRLARRIMPLKKLLTKDASLLEGHPSRTQPGRAVGKYQFAEILGNKQTLQQVTGVSLEHLEEQSHKVGKNKQESRRSMRLFGVRLLPDLLTATTS